jgi:branched-chain amino acid transport system substrate-binding protein
MPRDVFRVPVLIKGLICSACLWPWASGVRASEPIRIASIFAQSGVAADDNAPSVVGVREAVQEINAKGGVLGRKLEVIELDNLSTPIGAKIAAETAVKRQVTAIIGSAWSSHTLAMAPIAQASHTPLITNISTNEEVTKVGDCIFRMCFTDSFQGRLMARFAKDDLHAKTAITITDMTSDYAIGLTKEFESNFQQLGGRVLGHLNYRLKQATFTDLAQEVKAARPDVTFIPGYWESAVIIKEIMAQGSSTIPLGGDGWGTERFYDHGARDIPRAYYSTHWAEDFDSAISKAFVRKYKRGPMAMDSQEALSYDAVYLLVDAIRRAGSTNQEKVRDAIAATREFIGVTGNLAFKAQQDPRRSAVIMEISDGKGRFFKSVQP